MKRHKYQQRSRVPSPPKKYVDLHMHSTWSDGDLDTYELLEKCWRKGLSAISITDHDTVDGYLQAKSLLAGELSHMEMKLIPGIELSTLWDGSEIHILGYYFDPATPGWLEQLKSLQQRRRQRIEQITDHLRQLDIPIQPEDVFAKSTGSSVGRPHIAQVLMDMGVVNSLSEAFERWLGSHALPPLVDYKMTTREGIAFIQAAGGVAVMAHPAVTARDDLIATFREFGLDGLEAYYPKIGKVKSNKYLQMAGALGLIVGGGSDFHSDYQGYRHTVGSARVPEQILGPMQARKEKTT